MRRFTFVTLVVLFALMIAAAVWQFVLIARDDPPAAPSPNVTLRS